MNRPRLYTLGYEKRSIGEFVDTLLEAGVDMLVDVRQHAWSHRPEFCKKRLTESLTEAGIDYVHVPQLGNPKEIRAACRDTADCLHRYQEHLKGDSDALLAAKQVLRDAQENGQAICLTCFERDHEQCHRSVVVKVLNGSLKQWEVRHL